MRPSSSAVPEQGHGERPDMAPGACLGARTGAERGNKQARTAPMGGSEPNEVGYAGSARERAISIIWVKLDWRSSAGRDSPVSGRSDTVSRHRAFLPARAAFM